MAVDTEPKRWSMMAMAATPIRTHVFNPDTSGLVSIEQITVLRYYGGNAWNNPAPATGQPRHKRHGGVPGMRLSQGVW